MNEEQRALGGQAGHVRAVGEGIRADLEHCPLRLGTVKSNLSSLSKPSGLVSQKCQEPLQMT